VHNGVIIPDDAAALTDGTRVRITPASPDKPKSFGERFAVFKGAATGLPADTRRNMIIIAWERRRDDRLRGYLRAHRLAESAG
jgi:hypothetical protein